MINEARREHPTTPDEWRVTGGRAESLAAPTKANVSDIIASIGRAQTEDLMAEIQRNIEEYEQLKNTRLEGKIT